MVAAERLPSTEVGRPMAMPVCTCPLDDAVADSFSQRFGSNGSVPRTSESPEMPECARA